VDDRPRSVNKTMEDHTSFDLTLAVRQWRKNLAEAPEFQQTDLDELESHLRDSISTLRTSGLSAEEAFLLAARRIGPADSLAVEFQKVRHRDVVRDCVLWASVGLLIWGLFEALNPGVNMLSITRGLTTVATVMTLGISGQPLLFWSHQRAKEGYSVKMGRTMAMVLLLCVIGVLAANFVTTESGRSASIAQNRR
jgi:hypothetical protein